MTTPFRKFVPESQPYQSGLDQKSYRGRTFTFNQRLEPAQCPCQSLNDFKKC
jgi:hypothetical protein